MHFRFLIVDGYDRPARRKLAEAGCTPAGELYSAMTRAHLPPHSCDIITPADADAQSPGPLDSYHGVLWTGSSLTVYDTHPEVTRQIDLARALFKAGVPAFGSCWALQIATMAAGGNCRLNPKGREFGVARKIRLTRAGQAHPLYRGKPAVFDAFASHLDEVETLPPGALWLARNGCSDIQAAIIEQAGTPFWAVQYHPEYDCREIAGLTRFRLKGLVAENRFTNASDALSLAEDFEALHQAPDNQGLAWRLGVDQDVLDDKIRQVELVNWFEACVLST